MERGIIFALKESTRSDSKSSPFGCGVIKSVLSRAVAMGTLFGGVSKNHKGWRGCIMGGKVVWEGVFREVCI